MRCGAVRCGAVRCGAVRCGAVRCGAVRCGAVRCGAAGRVGAESPPGRVVIGLHRTWARGSPKKRFASRSRRDMQFPG
ncbi:hypothetical protein CFB43_37315 [Burkholderia sp. AU15512]|nr:hypothetical protein CFB43_37315 [Burkholderia sp. AU15512]